ncbi:MAG: VIT domain-containing protein [Cyanobacteriota bacterium]|nr:VIT domain-containing protein [Cyanobacteriota bacterium]
MSASAPTTAGLYVQTSDKQKLTFPLKHTEVKSKIAGNLSRVEVIQQFENPFEDPLEATYVFPLPDEAAVDEMEIKIGDRLIKGNIKKREEAQKIYQEAKQQGRTAGLLEQQRDNIFTQSLANIKPGEQIDVIIRYTDSLLFEGGDYEFVFPMVVGPRYIPGKPMDAAGNTDEVPDAANITPPVMPPGTRSAHDIAVTVEINAGMQVSKVYSNSHKIRTSNSGETITVQLGEEDTIPNKDLILRYRVASNNTKATVLTQADSRGGHFALYLIPALKYRRDEIVPKDVVFLMDTSGSQSGYPILQCQELMRRFIKGLNPDDTFAIIDFASTTTRLSDKPLANTQENRDRAIQYIDRLTANGGTEMLNGIEEVLKFPSPSEGRLRSIVMLTDGYIGNENSVLAKVQDKLEPGNRLYSFGVGNSVNRFLINRLAEVGRGIARIARNDEPAEEVAQKFFLQINNPVLTQIEIEWKGNGKSPDIYPMPALDLFAEQPLVLFGREEDAVGGELQITGIAAGGETYQQKFQIDFAEDGNLAVAQLWGRQRIKYLTNQMFDYEKKSKVEAVTETALTYQLLSQYTAFVAVSEEVRVEPGGKRVSVEVPVEMPEGVSYEGIFGSSPDELQRRSRGQSMSRLSAPMARGRQSVNAAKYYLQNTAPGDSGMAPEEKARGIAFDPATDWMPQEAERITLGGLADRAVRKVKKALSKGSSPSQATNPRLEVTAVVGLDNAGQDALARYLQNVELPPAVSGEIILELWVKGDRVVRVVVDDENTSLTDKETLEAIKRSLLQWRLTVPCAEKIEVIFAIAPYIN